MGNPNVVPIPVHVTWELEHFLPKVVEADAADWRLLTVFYLIPSPIFWDIWIVYSNIPHSKGMMADRGDWVIGAFGKRSMPYLCPKLLSRPRHLAVPCNVDEAQACAISMRRIHLSMNSWISQDVQVSSHSRRGPDGKCLVNEGKTSHGWGVLEPQCSSHQYCLEGFYHMYALWVVLIATR
jgi:hypothetical protein